jgi:hypothetical protein
MLQNSPLDIPQSVLDKLNEHTGGGFILFYVNETGETTYLPYADNQAVLRGLISYAQDITQGVRAAQQENIIEFFIGDESEEGEL